MSYGNRSPEIGTTNSSSEQILGKKLSSQDHRDAYQKIIDSSLRNEILKANEDLIASMESGSQISMRIVGTKESS